MSYASMAILKHNICTGSKTHWSRPATYPGEPFFIASTETGAAEDDGVCSLLFEGTPVCCALV